MGHSVQRHFSIAIGSWYFRSPPELSIVIVYEFQIAHHLNSASSFFTNSKEAKKIKLAEQSLASTQWRWKFRFVAWFCDWICSIQAWGKGSKQRDQALKDGCEYNHLWNGRRLPEAEAYVGTSLMSGLQEINSWDESTFGCDHASLMGLQVCVRASFNLAHKRHE